MRFSLPRLIHEPYGDNLTLLPEIELETQNLFLRSIFGAANVLLVAFDFGR